MMFPSWSRHIPFGLPRSVCGICQDKRKLPSGENFCTRPVISTTKTSPFVSQANDRGLLNSPTPTPRAPITSARSNYVLSSLELRESS